jgi:PhzF family phenazine biosynthesis protein
MKNREPQSYQYLQIDAFSASRYQGNAAAVVFDADALDDEQMQMIARQMNLSETVFLRTPTSTEADYLARIFTPKSELPFAGHPTIAAAHAWHTTRVNDDRKGQLTLRQQCGIGVVPVTVDSSPEETTFAITMGEAERRPVSVDRSLASRLLGCREEDLAPSPIESCSVGLPWLIVGLSSLPATRALTPDQDLIMSTCREFGATGLTVYATETESSSCDVHVRSFAPGEGIPEDPVCGSGNGAVALHIARHLRADESSFGYLAEQGSEMGYEGRISVRVTNNDKAAPLVRVGGSAVTVMKGELYL